MKWPHTKQMRRGDRRCYVTAIYVFSALLPYQTTSRKGVDLFPVSVVFSAFRREQKFRMATAVRAHHDRLGAACGHERAASGIPASTDGQKQLAESKRYLAIPKRRHQ